MAKNSPDEGKNIKMVEKQAVEASMINLKEYRAKRQFGKTPEPMAETVETPNRMPVFVVQKHDASHFHFDFRLEVDGVLKSWVVPKGPSMNPKDKRLAIEVDFLLEGAVLEVVSDASTETVLYADMPIKVQMKVTYTEPGVKGDTATNTLKPATVESGATVRVPLFINEGETIEIDTRDGSYVGRVKA